MANVRFIRATGEECRVDIEPGLSVMEVAVKAGFEEIAADCGGACACATCHVYVSPGDLLRFPEIGDVESEMLDYIEAERRPESRLGCQLVLDAGHDGVAIRLTKNR
ncbi:MAG: 2Fe-2S iron-sulfur cluster-binding protein [Parvibaculaceae bacterium]